MKKRDFFVKAINAKEYLRKEWVISAFAVVSTAITQVTGSTSTDTSVASNHYPYKIIQTPTGTFFIDPENNLEPTKIEDAVIGVPLFGIKEKAKFLKLEFSNLDRDVETTYGQALWNNIILVFPFGNKIPYVQGRKTVSDIETMILPKFTDNPPEGELQDVNKFYVSEYHNFVDAVGYISQFTQLCVPAATVRTMLPAPGIKEFRDKLLAENKDKLNDPAVIATIDAALVKYDKESMKGDLAEGFLINGKSYNIVRKKLFGMYGTEVGFTDGNVANNIDKSLSEGWDITKFPVLNDASRSGSFNRGAETQLGGEEVKWLQRASSNLRVTTEDCGTVLGKTRMVTNDNYSKMVGFSIIESGKSIKIETADKAKSYIGKLVVMRSPMYCKHSETDFCQTCVGPNLREHPTALALAVTDYGSTFMYIFMKAMHGKQLALAKMDYKTAIS